MLRLDDFEGTTYEGAFLYTTFSINEFVYQSVREVDPVDMWSLLGSAGGIWGKDTVGHSRLLIFSFTVALWRLFRAGIRFQCR